MARRANNTHKTMQKKFPNAQLCSALVQAVYLNELKKSMQYSTGLIRGEESLVDALILLWGERAKSMLPTDFDMDKFLHTASMRLATGSFTMFDVAQMLV